MRRWRRWSRGKGVFWIDAISIIIMFILISLDGEEFPTQAAATRGSISGTHF